jgi:hypothetical protein
MCASQSLVFEINPAQQQTMRNNKRMLRTILRKLKRSEHSHFGCEIAASGKRQYEADTVAVAYSATKTVRSKMDEYHMFCMLFYSAMASFHSPTHTHQQGDTIPTEATDAVLAFLLLR